MDSTTVNKSICIFPLELAQTIYWENKSRVLKNVPYHRVNLRDAEERQTRSVDSSSSRRNDYFQLNNTSCYLPGIRFVPIQVIPIFYLPPSICCFAFESTNRKSVQTENTCLFATFSSVPLGWSWTLEWISLKLYDEYTQTLNSDRKAHLVLNEIARSRFPRKSPDSLVS